jgi:hypothetical protein
VISSATKHQNVSLNLVVSEHLIRLSRRRDRGKKKQQGAEHEEYDGRVRKRWQAVTDPAAPAARRM